MELKVLHLENKPALIHLEQSLLESSELNEIERELQGWNAPWREEALNHYLPLGWSFGIWGEGHHLKGYLLAQPFLFFQGLSQVLWVEHLAFKDEETAHKLVEIAYRWSRDKHLQKVLFSKVNPSLSPILSGDLARLYTEPVIEVKTAKYV